MIAKTEIKKVLGGFLEAKIGGMLCVLINGRWVRVTDHTPYDKVKLKEVTEEILKLL